jgi:coproporphyrinogen III oxidase-like Fe-S oxidoreductase
VSEAFKAIEQAKVYPSVTLDFIYGLPNQELDEWTSDLQAISQFDVDHLSMYNLTLERGTPLFKQDPTMPNELLNLDLWNHTISNLSSYGYEQYEVSSFSRHVLTRSRHNMNYWSGGDYIGVGPGAHGKRDMTRTYRMLEPIAYINHCREKGNGVMREKVMGEMEGFEERVMVGLRTVYGIQRKEWEEIKKGIRGIERGAKELQEAGFLVVDKDVTRCTASGLAVVDSIASRLLV